MVVSYALGRLGGRVTRYPIETIVTFFVLTTLAYFHVLSAIKHSHFFTPTHSTTRPLYARYDHSSGWAPVDLEAKPTVEVVQVQLSIPGVYNSLQRQITDDILNRNVPYEAVCHRMNASTGTGDDRNCLTSLRPEAYTFTFDPSKAPNAALAFAHSLGTSSLSSEPGTEGASFDIVRMHESIADMRSGKWIAYAGRALILRFWSLAKVRDLDVCRHS